MPPQIYEKDLASFVVDTLELEVFNEASQPNGSRVGSHFNKSFADWVNNRSGRARSDNYGNRL